MLTRRKALGGALGACAVALGATAPARSQDLLTGLRGSLDATHEGLVPGAAGDQSVVLAQALTKAEASGQALFLPPGRYELAEVELPSRTHLLGVPGETSLVFRGGSFMLRARNAALLRLEGIAVDGAGLPLDAESAGMVDADGIEWLAIEDCDFTGSGGAALALSACAGRVERSRIRAARTIGLALSQSRGMAVSDNVVSDCGDTGILVGRGRKGADDTIVKGNRITAIRAQSGGTGQYGNGINIAQANGVIVAGNRVDDCAFSAIRCFSSDNVQVSGNTATRCGEMAVYVEFAFEGAIVSNNIIDGAAGGISFANFMEHRGRLGICSGNIVRNISGGPRYADGNPQSGAGIGVEADVAVTGNVVDNAIHGLQLGWGPYLRDVTATGNVIRQTRIGIAVSVVEGSGGAVIADNLISGATEGAILGMRWEEIASADLAEGGAEAFSHLTIEANRVS